MSSKYLAARDAFASGRLSWTDDMIVAQLLSAKYRFNEAHTLSDLTSDVVGEEVEIGGKEIVDGWLTCGDLAFKQVSGDAVAAIVFIRARDGLLIEHHTSIENFPLQPNGGDIEVEILEPGIFRI